MVIAARRDDDRLLSVAYAQRALARVGQGRLSDFCALAMGDLTEAVRLGSSSPIVYSLRAGCFRTRGDFDAAFADLDQAAKFSAPDERWRVAHNRGDVYFSMQRYREAIAQFDIAIGSTPASAKEALAESYRDRGGSWMGLGRSDRALADVNEALSIDPNNVGAYLYRALIHKARGDLALSRSDMARARQLDPRLPTID